jgi:RNA polymerase sigma-70 factor, ECF subfamily
VAIAPTPFDDAPRVVHDLYERHAVALRAFCLRSLRNRDDADEAVQATFLRALGAVRSGVRPVSERAWLLTIARNVCATRATCAHRRREVALDSIALEDAAGPAPPQDLGADADLFAALEALPDGQRRAFVLRAVDGLSYEEIAQELGVTHAAVETWIFRARRKLAEAVADRRRRLAADLSSAAGLLKSLLTGGAALKAGAVAVAAVAIGASVARTPDEPSRTERAPMSPLVRTPDVRTRPVEPRQAPRRRAADAGRADAATPRATVPAPAAGSSATPTETTAPPAPSTPSTHAPAPSQPAEHAPPAQRSAPTLPPTPLDPVLARVEEALAPVTEQLPIPDLTKPLEPLLPPLPVEPPKVPPPLP